MTTYGMSFPSAGGDADDRSPLDSISHANERCRSALGTRRPWREMGDARAFSLPSTLGEAYLRIRTNLSYFAINYAIVVILLVMLSLIRYPFATYVVWTASCLLSFYVRYGPLVILGRAIGNKVVLVILAVVTIILVLLITNANLYILVSLLIWPAVVVAHAALRRTEDLYLDEEAAGLASGREEAG